MNLLDRVRALSDFRVDPASGRGAVTAGDAGYFPGLQLLLAGCSGRVPLAIFDAGLTPAQRAWCAARAQVLDLPELLMPRSEPMWPAWNKPVLLRHSPFRTSLWLDADCLVVGDLNPLFDRAERGPFGIPSSLVPYPCPNKEVLYERHPVPARVGTDRIVNTGVLGFGPDEQSRQLLAAWESITGAGVHDRAVRDAFVFIDEGALHWAVEATGLDVGVPQRGWNRYTWAVGRGGPEAFLSRVKVKPGDAVLHLIIRPKPWRGWDELPAPTTF